MAGGDDKGIRHAMLRAGMAVTAVRLTRSLSATQLSVPAPGIQYGVYWYSYASTPGGSPPGGLLLPGRDRASIQPAGGV